MLIEFIEEPQINYKGDTMTLKTLLESLAIFKELCAVMKIDMDTLRVDWASNLYINNFPGPSKLSATTVNRLKVLGWTWYEWSETWGLHKSDPLF